MEKGRIDKEKMMNLEEITDFSEILPEEVTGSVIAPTEDMFDNLMNRVSAENEMVHNIVNAKDSAAEVFGEVELNEIDNSEINPRGKDLELGVNFMDYQGDEMKTNEKKEEVKVESNEDIGLDLLIDSEDTVKENVKVTPVIESNVIEDDSMKPEKDTMIKFEENKAIESEKVEELDEIDRDLENLANEEPVKPEVKEEVKDEEPEVLSKEEIDEDLLAELDDEKNIEKAMKELDEEDDKILKKIREEVSTKIKAINNPIDISTYTFSKKVKKTPNIMLKKAISSNHFTWLQSESQKPVVVTELTGTELINININNKPESMSEYAFTLQFLNTIYKHIQSPKAGSMNEWAKATPSTDLDDFFFAIYGAVYGKANHMFYSCDNTDCNNAWMTESISMRKLFKTENEEKVKSILNSTVTKAQSESIKVVSVQVSDDWVFTIKIPSIYNVYIESGMLTQDDHEKFGNVLPTLFCIDSIYYINKEEKSLEELEFKHYDTPEKTTRYRYRLLYKALGTLSPDQESILDAAIFKLNESREKLITYVIPEVTCEKCGQVIPEREITAQELLFTRHQFGAMRN